MRPMIWAGLGAMLLAGAAAAAPGDKTPPYWASFAAGDALMRTGPGREYPAIWRYRRVDLPVKVVAVHTSWRKIEEQDGTQGWVASVLLRDTRTAVIVGGTHPLRSAPDAGARVVWSAEAGVVGKIDQCAAGWCRFDSKGRKGYVEAAHIWGLNPGETLE